MSETVRAQDGDTLCKLAIAAGFPNCEPLRNEAANSDYLNRPLSSGDEVTIPDIEEEEDDGDTEAEHVFEELGVPEPEIRFVHGSRDQPFREDDSLTFLNVSNYVTNKAGTNGTEAMPTTYGFNAHAHADPDTFKIEVIDPGAGSDTVDVNLEALKPIYAADGNVERHENFAAGDPNVNMRQITVTCEKVSPTNQVRFRSRYMRLVVDDEDFNALSANSQTLLTTDMADGNNGANDQIEILDQRVRATYELRNCLAGAGQRKCTIVAELPIGEDRLLIRFVFHIFRTAPGAGAVGATTEQMVRKRCLKWNRRVYAQANMSATLVDFEVDFVDPPPDNMLVICNDNGRAASGVNAAGRPASLTFNLGAFGAAAPGPEVNVALAAGATPSQVGAAVIAALPVGYSGQAFDNPRAFNAPNKSCDVIITKDDGTRVMITNETTDDTQLSGDIQIARVDINAVESRAPFNRILLGTIGYRRILRTIDSDDDRMDCCIVGGFDRAGLLGRAFIPGTDVGADYQSTAPLRWAMILKPDVVDGSDDFAFVCAHEAGHVLLELFHTSGTGGATELMHAFAQRNNAVDASKQLCDTPVLVQYGGFDPAQATPGATLNPAPQFSAVDRLRERADQVTEDW